MFGKNDGNITFYYDSEKLFNDVSLMSAYMTKNLKSDTGSLMDEYSISDDEKDMYAVCVRQTLPNIYETMMKITSGVDNAFQDEVILELGTERNLSDDGKSELTVSLDDNGKDTNAKANTLGRFAGKYVEFTIQNNDSYNANVLNLIDATLLNCLKHGVLAEFYSICVNGDLYRIVQDRFTTSLFQLKQRLFQLKKKSVSSQLS
ncbi:MAG: hypothetical protein UD961_15865 [Bacteroidales bacterium]|nr:hypothetical protein [Bacteroidales bacterium]